ncbi:PAS domain-containing protein, partial [Acinetobacter baumannii]
SRDGIILWSNSRFARLLGVTRDDLLGRPVADWYADPAVAADLRRRLDDEGALVDQEAAMCGPAGQRWWALTAADRIDFEGQPSLINWYYD